MKMHASEFLPFLKLMQKGYNYVRGVYPVHSYISSRTDEVLILKKEDSLTIISVGTRPTIKDWFWNLVSFRVEWINMGKVHAGFAHNIHELLGRADQPNSLLTECIHSSLNGRQIYLTGHSRGFPLSCLLATQLVNHAIPKESITVIGCAGARLGNNRFKDEYSKMLGDRTYNLVGDTDPVPRVPPWSGVLGIQTKIQLGGRGFKHRLHHYRRALRDLTRNCPQLLESK